MVKFPTTIFWHRQVSPMLATGKIRVIRAFLSPSAGADNNYSSTSSKSVRYYQPIYVMTGKNYHSL